ncbi:MBOAT family O-acyltransferase [Gilvibacter sediminis]|uniref:MBOAT family O-acyltransferase n=1 Tax=Gilvibacter sediminis TaxID=379071 RepID=UPI002350D200|nr:MBOAT family O-acyltransferase [Gilvibacter sediminis]MDC7996795.1 MBOAT family protein [Gilvibacter sediminis]
MLFNSIDFAIFFPVFFVLYWLAAKQLTLRNVLILGASYLFYGWWDWRFLFLIIFSSFVDFFVGKALGETDKKAKRKTLLLVSLISNLGLLVYFKYANFFIDSFVQSFRFFGGEIESTTLDIILPVGISFYTFQTLSYTIDIYYGKIKPTKNMLAFFSFVAFFPQLVAGPIERAKHLLPQFFVTHKFNYRFARTGLLLMAFGLFKKMVIADRLGILVNQVYNDPESYGGGALIVATIAFAFQIYCDFSGYSDIAIGAARILGFDLMKNFDAPYFSKSITEFWRRWHISLSSWFRDYVYIPLGGSRKKELRVYTNLFIVFLVSGLWHGAAITFVIWGAIHGLFIVAEKAMNNHGLKVSRKGILGTLVFIPLTFIIASFAWIFFRANSTADALYVAKGIFDWSKPTNYFELGLDQPEFLAGLVAILLLLIFDATHRRFGAVKLLDKIPFFFRPVLYMVIVFTILIFGIYGEEGVSEFIYFQF